MKKRTVIIGADNCSAINMPMNIHNAIGTTKL